MADSDGLSPDTNDPNYNLPPQAKPLAPAPRVNPPNINTAKEAPPAGGPPGFNDFLEWMRNQVGGSDPAAGSSSPRGPLPKEKKKFQRRDTDAKAETPAVPVPGAAESSVRDVLAPEAGSSPSASTLAPDTTSPAARPDVASSTKGPPIPVEPLTSRVRRQQTPAKRGSWLGVATQLGALALLVGSFVLGRFSVSKVVVAPAAPAAPEVVNRDGKATTILLSDANATLIDQAMAAEQNRDFKTAADLLGKVKASGEHVRGLTFQLAQVAVFQGDFVKALPLLNDALVEGENVGEVYNMRATLSTGRGGLVRGIGMNEYETSTKVDPFGARNFYYWGSALRRVGKDQAAIVRLQQAIDRLREPEEESLYRLTLRLAQIEAGQEKDFADELAKQLALPNPEMDWLITAAAEEMHNGKFAAAAGYLDRAAARGGSEIFASRLRDYYLSQFRFEKELARFYAKAPSATPATAMNPPAPADSPAPDASASPASSPVAPTPPPPSASPDAPPPH